MSSRLNRLVRLLQRREDMASAAKARTSRAVADADAILAEAHRARRELSAPAAPLRPLDLQSLRLRGLGATAHIERALQALEGRRVDDAEAERDRSVAAMRRRSVERLAERRQTVAVRAAAAASQRAMDELAALRRIQAPPRIQAPGKTQS